MRRHNWKIRRQSLILSLLLFELFAIVSTVSGGIIKREVIEHTTSAVTGVTTEGIAITNVTSKDIPVIESTPLAIVRLTANDIRRQKGEKPQDSTSTTEVDTWNESTTETLVEILKAETTINPNIAKIVKTELDTSTEPIIEESVTVTTTDIPTTKDVVNSSNDNESGNVSSKTVATTGTTLENDEATTTAELPKPEHNKHIFDGSDSTTKEAEERTSKVENSETTTVDQQKEFDKLMPTTLQSIFDTQTASHHKDEEEVSTMADKENSYSTPYDQGDEESPTTEGENRDFETTTFELGKDHGSIHSNVLNEKNNGMFVTTSAIESTNYDIATNEIKNFTTPTKAGEKRPKLMKNSNMTLPDAPEVWALAGMKNVENTKEIDGKLGNITDEGNALPEINSTGPTKLLVDWTHIMKEVEYNNSIKNSPNSIENTLEIHHDNLQEPKQKLNEHHDEENQVTSVGTGPFILMNHTSTTSVPNMRFSETTENIVKTTPPIEKNQVEDVEESVYVKTNKIKTKDSTRNSSIKEINQISLPSTTAAVIIDKNTTATTLTPKSNILAKIVQSTTPHQLLTTTPISPSTIKATTEEITFKPETNQIYKDVTARTSTLKSIDSEVSSSIASSTIITTESDKQQFDSSTVQRPTEPTTEVSSNLDGTSTSGTDFSTQAEDISLTASSSSISEATSTESYEEMSSSTYEVPSSTILTQVKPGTNAENSTTTTEEYSKSTTVSYSPEDLSTTRIKITTSGQSIDSNAIEKFTESTTTGLDQFTSETSKMSTTTFIFSPGKYDTTPGDIIATEDISTTTVFQNTPTKYPHFVEPTKSQVIPKVAEITTEQLLPFTTTQEPPVGGMNPPDNNNMQNDTDYNVIIAISVSVVGIIALILLVGFLYVMRKRQKNLTYGQRCRPVSLDAYSLDNVSVYNSVRRKGALRASKRSYGNVAFDDPSLKHNVLNVQDLSKFVERKSTIYEEFKDVPQITARPDEVPQGCEDKNRYANVIPLPETRVILQKLNDSENSEYINANYVRGPKDPPNYYIACQAPLESTVADFWRMIWEQNSRVIIMATDLIENGKEKCAEYLPPSITIDNHVVYGDFQITLKNREVKEKYAVSTLHIKNTSTNSWREITHFWYQWPETGVPSDEAGVIAMLLEARSCLKMATQEQADEEDTKTNGNLPEANGNVDKSKSLSKTQGPLTVHCSPGTGRTGTIIACDIALRSLETPKRSVDIPQIVYYVRRGRASAVQTKEQYEFIYRVAHMYATKISGPINET